MAQTIRILLDKISIPELDTVADLVLAFNGNMDKIDAVSSNNCFTGSRAPAASDDVNANYKAGSLWVDNSAKRFYVCLDATAGAAVWREAYVKSGPNWLIDHGNGLIGLSDDDHTIYLLADGSRALTGDLNLNGHRLINLTTLDLNGNRITNLPDPGGPQDPLRLQDHWSGIYDNALINGNFHINSFRLAEYNSGTAPTNNSGNYTLDQWILQSDGNNIVKVIPEARYSADIAAGPACKLQAVTANKKFGLMQPVEAATTQNLLQRKVSLSALVYTPASAPVRNIRIGLVKWTNANSPNSVTRGIVSSWGAQGSNPTLAANWAFVGASSSIALSTDQFTAVKLENVMIPADAINLGFFIWADDTDCAIGDYISITSCKMNAGPKALPYSPPYYIEDLRRCARYLQIFNTDFSRWMPIGTGLALTTTYSVVNLPLITPLLKAPAAVSHNYAMILDL